MKSFIGLIFILFSNILPASEINVENWLLWHQSETHLPFASSLTIYPPVNLYAENGKLRGFIATPYEFAGENDLLISEFLIIVIDSAGRSHFLKPRLESVGFVEEHGIGLSSLYSESFKKGEVIIQLYKANTPENRKMLEDFANQNAERKSAIVKTLTAMAIPLPKRNEIWDIKAHTTDGKDIDDIIVGSDWTIFQLYSPYCGFCRNAIPAINTLERKDNMSVIGIAGPLNNVEFSEHINKNNIHYPFITFEGEHTESALLKAVGQLGFPSYLVVNNQKKVTEILVGTAALDNWLNDLERN
ncbi:redoxin [uncultured Paraglaciecola sp.]|uniref:TlpA family protein disulfide reductase n=1 Tax=uncultured Paraglaciecola sp. TaxID=1765024 RepID=UPI0030DB53D2|tara:strand:+ start:68594 stop:69496 length:903 start_codon:yes stop_codon:yes gene_type:complete